MVCTRVAILARGQICGSGTVEELAQGMHSERVTFELLIPSEMEADSSLGPIFAGHEASELVIAPIRGGLGTHRVTATLTEQHQVDEVVDRLRALGISIIRLEVKRPTLEDMFMKLVSTTQEPA